MLLDSIGHPCIKLVSLEFSTSFHFQFRASRYITGLNRKFEKKVIVIWLWYELPFSNWSIWIYYRTLSEIWVKSFCHLNLLRASVFNKQRLDILWNSIEHPCINLLSFQFGTSFHFQFWASPYITGLNRTFEKKVIVVWIWYELPFSNWSIWIYYRTLSNIWVKSYCHLTLLRASVFNMERLDILWDSIGHPCIKLLSFEFAQSSKILFRACR